MNEITKISACVFGLISPGLDPNAVAWFLPCASGANALCIPPGLQFGGICGAAEGDVIPHLTLAIGSRLPTCVTSICEGPMRMH